MLKALLFFLATAAVAAPLAAQPKVLRVVSDNNYPPYLFLGSDGKPRGYIVDEWKLWQQKTGIRVDLIATDWDDAQKMLLSGRADVIEMIFATPERERYYDFTAPYAKVTVGIYVDASISGIDNIDGLRGFEVGVERGDACVQHLQRDGIQHLRLFTGYADMIAAQARQDIRILCMDEFPANYYLYKLNRPTHLVKAFDYYTGEFRRGVRKGDLQTAVLVDRGMRMITRQERNALKRKWMGQPINFTPYAQFFGYALLALALVGIALTIWVYTLRRAVKRRTKDLGFLAYHDALTGLPNRYLLIDRLDHGIKQAGEANIAVLLIGLDNFKRVNESFGHAAGDLLLKEMAGRFMSNVTKIDTVARIGDDEFAVTMQGALDTTIISAAAEAILRVAAKPLPLNGSNIFVSASVGIGIYPGDGEDGASLLKHAYAAMDLAKRDGRNRFRFYRSNLTEQAQELLHLGTGLRRALDRNEFLLLYQPQVALATGQIIGVEALLRWQSEDSLINPDRFIPYAEETGLITPIGYWVLQTACHQLARWREEGLPALRMAVNLSPHQFASPDLVEYVTDALGASALPPEQLELEITEGTLMQQGDTVTSLLTRLRELGVSVAIDDFGTGYSSLAYLRHFPIALLKIDQSFMQGVPHDQSAVEITSTIVAMARNLHLGVLAEGVETVEQWEFLKSIGCGYAQGWYIGRPMTADNFKMWMTERGFCVATRQAPAV